MIDAERAAELQAKIKRIKGHRELNHKQRRSLEELTIELITLGCHSAFDEIFKEFHHHE